MILLLLLMLGVLTLFTGLILWGVIKIFEALNTIIGFKSIKDLLS